MNLEAISHSIDMGDGKTITLETGKLARQADGSILLSSGNTRILATVVSAKTAREGIDFLPLSVDYQEKFASVGRVPGSFLRREGRLSDYEVLICRLVDRALRPMFPGDYHADTQVNIQLVSSDDTIVPDCLVGLAASAAITITDIPFEGPISEVRVARVDGKFIINPLREELENADLELIVAGTANDINMVEGEAEGVSEQDMLEALKLAHEAIKKQCAAQMALCEKLGGRPEPREYDHEKNDPEMRERMMAELYQPLYDVAKVPADKTARSEGFDAIYTNFVEGLDEEYITEYGDAIKRYFKAVKKKAVRNMVLETRGRLDGRKLDEVRPIWTEVNFLPTPHGSALFTRGETQSLTTVTLGSKLDEQLLDSPNLSGYSKFMLHYNFPAFSTGEVRPNRGPGRREIGHGNLASRGLKRMLPEDVGYTIRIVSDILESNGSSSMATVCAGSMALMDAGIQLKAGLSGIAMGMISDEETGKYAILTDILGDEDHLGDMDFKVVGNENGIYACQMDMKVNGLSYDVLEEALMQAKAGRMHVLTEMQKTISTPNTDLKPHAPRLVKFTVPKDKIGAIIGSGGKVIQELQAKTETTITIDEVDGMGVVEILSPNKDGLEKAKAMIDAICEDPEIGKVYEGPVKGVMDFGAFIEFLPGKQGLLHISEISWKRLDSMEGVLEDGEMVKVKLLEIDEKTGKFRLSRKALLEKPEGYVEPEKRERGPRDRDRDRGGRGGRDRRDGGRRDGNRRGNDRPRGDRDNNRNRDNRSERSGGESGGEDSVG
ncbi:MAG: polyribonucleotide nucleotidyltransferase [Flavobacteriales bacterium]|nr:polyribonucleotide nucleotidyltransferase [Flavobacteriales bacterium]